MGKMPKTARARLGLEEQQTNRQTNNPSFSPYEKPILPSSVQILRFLVFNSEHKAWRLERKTSPTRQWREERGGRLAAGRGERCV